MNRLPIVSSTIGLNLESGNSYQRHQARYHSNTKLLYIIIHPYVYIRSLLQLRRAQHDPLQLTSPLPKFPGPVLKLLDPLLRHTRSNRLQTRHEILHFNGPDILHGHIE